MELILKKFGEQLRVMRLHQGISQEHLAELAQLDRTYISMLERGKRNPSLICLHTLSLALNISILELIPDTTSHDK